MYLCYAIFFLSTGGTIVGAPFGGYAPFGHPPSAVLPPPRHAAFYPQPILYWGYPSPPVSPTTYYSTAPPPGTPHHLGPAAAHQTAPGIQTHGQPTMLALSPDQRNQRSNPSVSLVTTVPSRPPVGTAGSSSGESSTSQSSSPPLLSPTGGCSSSGSVTSSSSGTSSQRHGAAATAIRTSSPPQQSSASLLSLPLASVSQPLAIPAVTTPTGGLAGAYPGSQLSPIQAIPPPSVHFPHHAPLMGTASPPGTTGTTFYEPHPHLPHHHPSHHHPHHHHHPHPLTHHHHDKLVATAPSILTPSLIPNQYVELFIV